jgi:hypothetical protein
MHQLTLGELIAALEKEDQTLTVRYDFVHFAPAGIHSYRGYYDQLAIGYDHTEITVAKLLNTCKLAVGCTFTGYKGGNYKMDRNTRVWVANYNESGSTAIVGVRNDGWIVTLLTASIE